MENRKRNVQIIIRVTEEELAWARMQKLRKNKRRPTRTGKTNMFSGIVRCVESFQLP